MKKLIKKYGSGNAISTGGTENTSPLTGNAAYDYSNNFENQLLNRLKNNQGMSGGWNLGGSVNSLGGDIASTFVSITYPDPTAEPIIAPKKG